MIDLDLTPYNLIALSTSGGKDSEVTMIKVAEAARKQGVLQRVIAIHSATGADWSCTEDIASKIAKLLNIPLYVVQSGKQSRITSNALCTLKENLYSRGD